MDTPDDLVEAFKAAVPFALREMADVEAVVRDSRPATAADGFADLAATVRLATAGGEWRFVLSMREQVATALAGRILAQATTEATPDMVRDCLGEVANVVAGQAKALLVGSDSHFTLSTPSVRTGDQVERVGGVRSRWVIQFDSDAGEFDVSLCPPSDK